MTSVERVAAPAETRRPKNQQGDGRPRDPLTAPRSSPIHEPGHTHFDGARRHPTLLHEPALHEALLGMYYLG